MASVSIREADDANGRTSLSDELEDENRSSRADMWGHVAMGFAGLVAEELAYGHDEVHGGGCASDIGKATHAVRRLLGELAGSAELGAVSDEVCPHPSGMLAGSKISGAWTVTGGTGAFAGMTGSGTSGGVLAGEGNAVAILVGSTAP